MNTPAQATPMVATPAQLDRIARYDFDAGVDVWEAMQDNAEVAMLRESMEPRRFTVYTD